MNRFSAKKCVAIRAQSSVILAQHRNTIFFSAFICGACVMLNADAIVVFILLMHVAVAAIIGESMSVTGSTQNAPYAFECAAGNTYFWCACGKSANQPFCDRSHKGTEFTPVAFKADDLKKMYFCGCKKTENVSLSDGTHNR